MTFAFTPRPNDRKSWDADDLDRLHEWISVGTPVRVIAERLGRTQEAVRRKARMLDRLGPEIPA